jgi:hypothetical protein
MEQSQTGDARDRRGRKKIHSRVREGRKESGWAQSCKRSIHAMGNGGAPHAWIEMETKFGKIGITVRRDECQLSRRKEIIARKDPVAAEEESIARSREAFERESVPK